MALFEWLDDYCTGHPRIDREHRELFRCINDFGAAQEAKDGAERVQHTLHYLHHYALTHFKWEEDHMEAVGYPGLADHRLEHENLLRQVREMLMNLNGGEPPELNGFALFVKDWVAQHIQENDKRFARWAKSKKPHEGSLQAEMS